MKLRLGHLSLQFSDTNQQHTQDIETLFNTSVARDYAWITGGESGPGAGNTGRELIRVGRTHGYRVWVPSVSGEGKARYTDCWIAVREDLIHGNVDRNFILAFPGSTHFTKAQNPSGKRWGAKGLVSFAFDNNQLGRINIGAGHYLTGGQKPGSPYWSLNQKLAQVLGDWARTVGATPETLAFYGGDQNMEDDKNNEPQGDTFFGEPFTSAWDELGRWRNTGHGVIDVIASYDRDRRVVAKSARVFNDKQLFLNTDHFLIEAEYEIKELPTPTLKSLEQIAQEVLAGLWDNGDVRKRLLTEAGYDYDAVQAKVAELLTPKPVDHACPSCGNVHTGIIA